ncbi:MAG: hypothetical protein WAK31_25470 [Chthoniobacterales bacterium]
MLKKVLSGWLLSVLAALFFSETLVPNSFAGNPVTVQLYSGLSNPVYVEAGVVTINYSYMLWYGGRGDHGQAEAASMLVYNTAGDLIATLPVSGDGFTAQVDSATVTWNNPVSQFIELSGEVYILSYGNNFFESWYLPEKSSVASGGDTPDKPGQPVTTVTLQPPSSAVNTSHSNIHAVIISGLSDPAKVIASPNVTVTGGIVALGKIIALGAVPSAWSPGLRVLPDYQLLTGAKVPPVTPNIIDVRIVRQQTTADFPSPGQSINN